MSDEAALLTAITAHPEEDTPRLAYADWLDENADALPDPALARVRAELIRVQVELLGCPYWLPGHLPRYVELGRRDGELQARCFAAIFGTVNAARGIDVRFSRGFPYLRMPVGRFLTHSVRLEHLRAPSLTVVQASERWHDLFTHPLLPLVTDVVMGSRSTYPYRREGQSLDAGIIGRMGELGGHNRLHGLDLSGCLIGDTGLGLFAEHADVWRLDNLDLSHNDIHSNGLMEMLLTPIPTTLRRVNLCGNPIGDSGARVLADRWPADGPLMWLRLEGTNIGPDGRNALVARFGEKVEFGPGA